MRTWVAQHRRVAAGVGILLAVAVAIGATILLRSRDDDAAPGAPVPLSGRWIVTSIDVGSTQPIVVPREVGAVFYWTPAGPQRVPLPNGESQIRHSRASLDASDGGRFHSCSYDRVGDRLTLRDCIGSLNLPLNRTDLEKSVAASFDHAFRARAMTVTSTSNGDLTVTLGGTVFRLTKD